MKKIFVKSAGFYWNAAVNTWFFHDLKYVRLYLTAWWHSVTIEDYTIHTFHYHFNPFAPKFTFLFALKTSENLMIFSRNVTSEKIG